MKGNGRQWRFGLVFSLALCPCAAMAAEEGSVTMAAIPALAMLLALAVAVFACITFRRRTIAAEASVLRLKEQAALQDAVAALRGEQAIIWPFADAEEIGSVGLASLLNIDAVPGGWYDAFRDLLSGPDRDALEQAVDGLRKNRHDFNMAVTTRDGARTFAVRGDSVVAGAVGAAVHLNGDRPSDTAQNAR